MNKLFIAALLLVFLSSCDDKKTEETLDDDTNQKEQKKTSNLSPEVIEGIIQSIPNPYETSVLIKSTGAKYDPTVLNNVNNISNYNTDFQKALNLGIYSTDLGFSNIYEQTQDAMNFLKAIQSMAKGLNVEQFFDYNTIKKLASNSEKLDELITVSTMNVQEMNDHLQKEDRTDMTILILTGAWIEAVYLTTTVSENLDVVNEDINFKIADQKITLSQLLKLLNLYESSPKMRKLRLSLNELNKIYDEIKITYTKGEPQEVIEDDGTISFTPSEQADISITQSNITDIYNKLSEIRKGIIN